MRAALAGLPFENPKLSVSANVGPNHKFAERLEAAIKLREPLAAPQVIEGTAERMGTRGHDHQGNDRPARPSRPMRLSDF
jgi:hypothetical protein